MRRHSYCGVLFAVALILASILPAAADEGKGRVKLGYVLVEDEGDRSLYQETYNLYEGGVVSIEDAWYTLDNGLRFRANLENISLENRNLTFSLDKSKRFSASLYDNKYRRVYESTGGLATKREALGGRFSVSPVREVKLYADFDLTDKDGMTYTAYESLVDPVAAATDYRHASFAVGAEGYHFGGSILVEYRALEFKDRARDQNDRSADQIRLSGTIPIPTYERVVVSGGYTYRQDEIEGTTVKLRTDMGWGATKVYLPRDFLFDYRVVYAFTKHKGSGLGTENVFNTVALTRTWSRRGGARIGYDNRWTSDRIDRRSSDGVLFNAWYNHQGRVFLRAVGGVRSDDDEKCATLIGDQNYVRYQATAKYTGEKLGDFAVQYQARDRKREELGTSVSYDAFSAEYGVAKEKYGRATLSYTYYLGKFGNLDGSFGFSDHVVTARFFPATVGNVTLSFGGVYFASERDIDIEKFGVDVAVAYALPKAFGVEAKYTRYDYQDFQVTGGEYASDVVEAYVVRDFDL